MRYLLAKPYPDELLGSVWSRTARRLQLPISVVTRAVTGGVKFRPGVFHLGYLDAMSSALRVAPGWLLWHHTVFPYTTAFYRAELLGKAVSSAVSTGPAARTVGPIVQSVSDHSRLRRFCYLCAREELAEFGETYWHRDHNLPGVLACVRHQCLLLVTALPIVSTRWVPELPGDFLASARASAGKEPSAGALVVAHGSRELLAREPYSVVHRDAGWYRSGIESLGLATPGRFIDASKLAAWLRSQLGDDVVSGLAKSDQALQWSAHMMRPGYNAPFVSFKHVLFQSALLLQKQVQHPLLNHVPTGFRGFATREADANFARAVRRVVRKYVAMGERVRVKDVLVEADCWGRFRHARSRYPLVAREVERLKASAACMRPNWGKAAAGHGAAGAR